MAIGYTEVLEMLDRGVVSVDSMEECIQAVQARTRQLASWQFRALRKLEVRFSHSTPPSLFFPKVCPSSLLWLMTGVYANPCA